MPLEATPLRSRTILIVAGEASGDLHGAGLVHEMRKREPSLRFVGLGGERLRAAGMEILVDTAEVATMGITEVFGSLGRLWRTFRSLVEQMDRDPPALLILIDYPDFNLRLARQARRRGIPVFYFIGPQVWAWRRGRIRQVLERVDRIALVFPFEPPLYGPPPTGVTRPIAEYVGHPLIDTVRCDRSRAETRARYGLAADRPLLAILPGSRKKEIRLLLPPALAAARELRQRGWQALIALAHTLSREDLEEAAGGPIDAPVASDDTYNVLHAADVALVTSGTATLETALLERPMVIMYRVSALSYAIGRALVRIDHIGMPNIILGRRAFPEVLQSEVTPARLTTALLDVFERRAALQSALIELREKLGHGGATARAAELALELAR